MLKHKRHKFRKPGAPQNFFRTTPKRRSQEKVQNENKSLPEQEVLETIITRPLSQKNSKNALQVKHQIRILHQNMQEMSNKIDRLNHLLEETKPGVLILSEHGLKEHQLNNTRLTNYSLKSSFCRENHRKGGVALFVKDGLEAQEINIQNNKELTIEMGMIKIILRKRALYILGVYRTPLGHLEEALNILSAAIEDTKADMYPILIMGDINVDGLKEDRNSQMLNNTLSSHNILRLPLPHTRVTTISALSIDFICSNLNNELIKSSVIQAGISDL